MDNKTRFKNAGNMEIKKVPFMGAELMAARDADGQIWAGVSYICRGIGLSEDQKRHQIRTVQSDEVLKEGCVKFDTGVFDPNNPTIAINLHKAGVQYKQGNVWLLYQTHTEMGYTSTKTIVNKDKDGTDHAFPHTYWTQKGRLFIYELLKGDGIFPAIERDTKDVI